MHVHLLDEIEEDELEGLDLSRAGDYILWAAAQALEDLDRDPEALAILKRLAASASRHPALDYPGIVLHLADRLTDRADYDEALAALDDVERLEADLRPDCDERRAEILILRGRAAEGQALFHDILSALPGDPWVPLRAAWALLSSGRYDEVASWTAEAERRLRGLEEDEARPVASEIDRLRRETEARRARRERLAATGDASSGGLAGLKEEILARLDAEESRLTGNPPRTGDARARATERLAALRARASRGWDDAVEARDERMIAEFDELRWEVAGLAVRFGFTLPEDGEA